MILALTVLSALEVYTIKHCINSQLYIIFVVCTAPRVVEKLSLSGALGMTSVDDELFFLLLHPYPAHNRVAIYSVNDYKLLRHLNVPGFEPDNDSDMTSCEQHKCLYISDPNGSCIRRYGLASRATSKWPVPSKPRGLSVIRNGNLLVTCWGATDKLVELSGFSGRCVREIVLDSEVVGPHHSLQLSTGQYVVCHDDLCGGFKRACVVGDDGKVTQNVEYLSSQCHFAVDKDSQFIFVADSDNGRVLLLSPTLEFIRYVMTPLYCSRRLNFHHATRRLFVYHGSTVTVIQL